MHDLKLDGRGRWLVGWLAIVSGGGGGVEYGLVVKWGQRHKMS